MSVASAGLDETELQDLTFDLCATLNRESTVEAAIVDRKGETGTKGDTIEIGKILLTLIGSGGVVVTFLGILKSYIERGHRIKITLQNQDGKKIDIQADNLSNAQIEQTRKIVQDFLKE